MPSEPFDDLRQAIPDKARVSAIQKALSAPSAPVRALPSDSILIGLVLATVIFLSVIGTMPFGFDGYRSLSSAQALFYYGVAMFSALLLAMAVTQQMIPGSPRRVSVPIAVVFPVLAFSLLVPFLFPEFGLQYFVKQGIPCLRLGLLLAIPTGALTGLFLRWGFVTDSTKAAVSGGALAGLVGVGVLALHCPIHNAAHVITWHLGVILIAALTGATISWAFSRRSRL